jgi:prepilin-type N-terminal cleavage/methylation domain-containing protein
VRTVKIVRERLGLRSAPESGLSLIEVMVAMMIFALISTGIIYTMLSMMNVSRDSRVRQVATNLAAEEVDLARGLDNVVSLGPADTVRQLNGDTFYIKRTVEWVSDPNSTLQCGASASGEKLRYKKVNVRVSWDGMRAASSPVQADTVINPRERINDPNKGTILVSVVKSDGTGSDGVTVTATPALAMAASPTDTQGCTFALKVLPNTYTVKLSKTGYVDEKNDPAPIKTGVVVTAGSTLSLPFQYDLAASYTLSYPAATAPISASMPNGMPTSFINTYRTHLISSGTTHKMHPDRAGYTIAAGDAKNCPAVDPSNWPDSADGSLITAPLPSYGSSPGQLVSATVPMQTVTVSGVGWRTITAVSQTGAAGGDCLASVSYTFPVNSQNTRTLALPYGAWSIYGGPIVPGQLLTTITLDPRVAP